MISNDAILDPRAIAVGDTLHVVGTGGSFNCYYLKSNDNGLTWSDPVRIAETLENSETPEIIYSHNRIHVAFVGYYEPTTIYHISSSDGGESWSSLHQVFNTGPLWLAYPKMAANGDTLFLSCAMENRILFFRSFDDGVTWQDSTVVESGTLAIIWPQSLVFTAGKLCLAEELWTANDSITYEIYCRTSDDYGLTWSERIPISTVEKRPHALYVGQQPIAYSDSLGDICISWMDGKYGSICAYSGDILARCSNINSEGWLPEYRLTHTQSGETPFGIFADGVNIVVIKDNYPLGCICPKITLTKSTDQGSSWTPPELISGNTQDYEMMPFLFQNTVAGEKTIHCVFVRYDQDIQKLYYTRNSDWASIEEDETEIQPDGFNLRAYPNPFNSSTLISFEYWEKGDLKAEIFDICGKRVKSIDLAGIENRQIAWDATDNHGNRLSSGVYYFKLRNKNLSETLKLLFVK